MKNDWSKIQANEAKLKLNPAKYELTFGWGLNQSGVVADLKMPKASRAINLTGTVATSFELRSVRSGGKEFKLRAFDLHILSSNEWQKAGGKNCVGAIGFKTLEDDEDGASVGEMNKACKIIGRLYIDEADFIDLWNRLGSDTKINLSIVLDVEGLFSEDSEWGIWDVEKKTVGYISHARFTHSG